jgi:hypothetical protein
MLRTDHNSLKKIKWKELAFHSRPVAAVAAAVLVTVVFVAVFFLFLHFSSFTSLVLP